MVCPAGHEWKGRVVWFDTAQRDEGCNWKMEMPNKRVYTDMDNEETSKKQANKQGIFYLLLLRILFSLSYSFAS